jgi:hypothetical protein
VLSVDPVPVLLPVVDTDAVSVESVAHHECRRRDTFKRFELPDDTRHAAAASCRTTSRSAPTNLGRGLVIGKQTENTSTTKAAYPRCSCNTPTRPESSCCQATMRCGAITTQRKGRR